MKYFCTVPWLQQDITRKKKIDIDTFCCWTDKTIPDFSRANLQSKFLSGEKPIECSKCWQTEDRGEESRRLMENSFFDWILDMDENSLKRHITSDSASIISYQIMMSSTCNAACVTCSSESSSLWSKYEKKLGQIPISRFVSDQTQLAIIDFSTVKSIRLLGGEPLLDDNSYWMFTQLAEHNNLDCFISIITNGTIPLSPRINNLLRKFKRLNICLSIDATGDMFEYIRFPLKWVTILKNIKAFKEICNDVTVSFTVSNLNIHKKDEIIEWFVDNDLKYIVNYVRQPLYFAPDVQPDHKLWDAFAERIQAQDKVKGIHIKDYIPEVWDKIQKHNLHS